MKITDIFEATLAFTPGGDEEIKGTDSRMQGTDWEAVFFDKDNKQDFNKLEKGFWKDNEVLLQGWQYAGQYTKTTSDDVEEFEKQTGLDVEDDVETMPALIPSDETLVGQRDGKDLMHAKKQNRIEGDYENRYKKLVQQLRKIHNF